jgi:hypothetical protein
MGWEYCSCSHRIVHSSQGIHFWVLVAQHSSNGIIRGNYERKCTLKYYKKTSRWNLGANWNGKLGGTENHFHHKNWYFIGSIKVISNYMFRTSTKKVDLASGYGINNEDRHYQHYLMWVMFPIRIHHQRVVTIGSFISNLLWKICQILDGPLELNFFNLMGSDTRYNNLLVLKNIIFNRGPYMALWRFHVRSHGQLLHQVKFDVSLYFWFSSSNVDSNLLLLCNMQNSKAFSIHHVKLSSLTNRRYIPTFSL